MPPRKRETYGLPVTIGAVTLKTITDFVIHVENQLGWTPNESQPLHKVRGIEVAKLKRKIAEKPTLYTWRNLLIAVEYCRRKQIRVASPVAVCWKVEKALKEIGPEAPVSPVAERIQKAIAWEHEHDLSGKDDWVSMLTRAAGDAREHVLADWKRARFG
jgi:hypothetical protein